MAFSTEKPPLHKFIDFEATTLCWTTLISCEWECMPQTTFQTSGSLWRKINQDEALDKWPSLYTWLFSSWFFAIQLILQQRSHVSVTDTETACYTTLSPVSAEDHEEHLHSKTAFHWQLPALPVSQTDLNLLNMGFIDVVLWQGFLKTEQHAVQSQMPFKCLGASHLFVYPPYLSSSKSRSKFY